MEQGLQTSVLLLASRPGHDALLTPLTGELLGCGCIVEALIGESCERDNLAAAGVTCHQDNRYLEEFITSEGRKCLLYVTEPDVEDPLAQGVTALVHKYGIPSLAMLAGPDGAQLAPEQPFVTEVAADSCLVSTIELVAGVAHAPQSQADVAPDGRPVFQQLGYERYVRLMGLAEEINRDQEGEFSLLDIGGEDAALRQFIPDARYEAYDQFITRTQGTNLDDDQFDVVVAADVLEHVLNEDRTAFLRELVRIARCKVVFSFPCAEANPHEQFILSLLPKHRWLSEHQANGLPDKALVDSILAELNLRYEVRPNHNLTSWVYSVVFDHMTLDEATRFKINAFLQATNFPIEDSGPCYRYIYTVFKGTA